MRCFIAKQTAGCCRLVFLYSTQEIQLCVASAVFVFDNRRTHHLSMNKFGLNAEQEGIEIYVKAHPGVADH